MQGLVVRGEGVAKRALLHGRGAFASWGQISEGLRHEVEKLVGPSQSDAPMTSNFVPLMKTCPSSWLARHGRPSGPVAFGSGIRAFPCEGPLKHARMSRYTGAPVSIILAN